MNATGKTTPLYEPRTQADLLQENGGTGGGRVERGGERGEGREDEDHGTAMMSIELLNSAYHENGS